MLHKHKIMVLDLLWLSANSKRNLRTEGTPRTFCVVYIMERLSTKKNILMVTFPLPKKLPAFTLLVPLSFHILINDSQKLSVQLEEKNSTQPSDLPVPRDWIWLKSLH